MTKLRPPITFERALVRIADRLGFEAMAVLIGKSGRTVMDYSDPDTPTGIGLRDALVLDRAYRADGGEGAPIGDCFRLQLEMGDVEAFACRDEVARAAVIAIKESGDANAALAQIIRPGASPADIALAIREGEEAVAATTNTLALLARSAVQNGSVERVVPEGGMSSE